jgi:hypothetical protein
MNTVALLERASEQERTLTFGHSLAEDLELMRYLREATSHAIRLRWTLAGLPLLPLHTHIHLIRPSGGVDESTQTYADAWGSGYRYGIFYYRQGPGFVSIKDVRPDQAATRMVIDTGAEHFLAMAAASTVADLSPPALAVLDEAERAGLVLRHEDRILALPFRMRHWPVPYIGA